MLLISIASDQVPGTEPERTLLLPSLTPENVESTETIVWPGSRERFDKLTLVIGGANLTSGKRVTVSTMLDDVEELETLSQLLTDLATQTRRALVDEVEKDKRKEEEELAKEEEENRKIEEHEEWLLHRPNYRPDEEEQTAWIEDEGAVFHRAATDARLTDLYGHHDF